MRRPFLLFVPLVTALAAGCGVPPAGTPAVTLVSVSPIVCTRDAESSSTIYDCTSVSVVAVVDAPSSARLHVELQSDLLGDVSLDGWTALDDGASSSTSVEVSVQHVAVTSCNAGDGLAQRASAGIDDGSGNESPQDVRYNVPITVTCGN